MVPAKAPASVQKESNGTGESPYNLCAKRVMVPAKARASVQKGSILFLDYNAISTRMNLWKPTR